jgi:signal transduction histidine kinase
LTSGDEARLLADVAALVTGEPVGTVLPQVARLLTRWLGGDGCLVYRVAADGELTVVAAYPALPPEVAELRLPAGFGVTGRVAVDGVPAVFADDNPRNARHRELLGLRDGQTVSRLCVPARVPDNAVAAVLAVHSYSRRAFTPGEVAVAQRVADLVGLRVHLDRAAAALADLQREWEGLVAATVSAQEAERRRVAGDLHDGVTQAIASLTFHLSAADVAMSDRDFDDAAAQLRAARELADLAFAEARSAISGLHSPVLDDLGLAAGLVSMARAVPSLTVEVDADDVELPEHVATALFRIAQEAVQNVVKHADAAKAIVRLERHGRTVVLSVTDDGRGFEAPGQLSGLPRGRAVAQRYGLAGMFERVQLLGGQLSVTSELQRGTRVEVVVPGAAVSP